MIAEQKFYSREEYLTLKEKAEFKSEYLNSEIVGMAGASFSHVQLVLNVSLQLGSQIKGRGCKGFVNDLRVYIPECSRYYYPDFGVVCGTPNLEQIRGMQNLLNPTLILEVLSPSTEHHDRGDKLECYRIPPSLQYYLLVSQDRAFVEVCSRLNGELWSYETFTGTDAVIALDKIGCTLDLPSVYEEIEISDATYPIP